MGTGNGSLYDDVTQHIIAQLEEGRLPWVQPWDTSLTVTGLLRNAATGRCYSGINILILLDRLSSGAMARSAGSPIGRRRRRRRRRRWAAMSARAR
ncbi:ArdC-like ssDNA-binding domain-containing protein [Sphingobium yanoikuyae]|uniref:ArdC-like ssDNA-binding domain-containing protein n=1 Tax=Sphingobium yanoikuyae TaxID=13690 RepID=UPI0035C6CD6E